MIERIDSYQLKCDGCNTQFCDSDGTSFSIFADEESLEESARDADWIEAETGYLEIEVTAWYCPMCAEQKGFKNNAD